MRMDQENSLRLYRQLRLIRRTEEEVIRLYPSDRIKSPVHLSIGQEAVAVGVCDALNADDAIAVTYRGHAGYLAKGGDLKAFWAELYGKSTGCAGGRGGSMHLVDPQNLVIGASAVVATHIPVAAGWAFAFQREGKGRAVVCFTGDGSTEEGAFLETVNFAALKRLPLLIVVENNGYAIHNPIENRWASSDLLGRIRAFGVPAEQIDGNDLFAVRDATLSTIDHVRRSGPALLEVMTYRWREHVGPNMDYDQGYRGEAELRPWLDSDALESIGRTIPARLKTEIDGDIERQLAEAIAFAENSPFPDPAELYDHVYA